MAVPGGAAAGKSSDISYYLNSHHIDIHNWALAGHSRPASVVAMASTGVGKAILGGQSCEDTITLMVQWEVRRGLAPTRPFPPLLFSTWDPAAVQVAPAGGVTRY